jgi:peptide/nickel transport system permease protein
MGRYAAIKLLLIIPSLILLSLIVFFLSKLAPGDPVASVVELRGQVTEEFNTGEISPEYLQVAEDLNLLLPDFYFSIQPSYYPDTLFRIIHPDKKERLKNWLEESRDWPSIQLLLKEQNDCKQAVLNTPDSLLSQDQKQEVLQWLKNAEKSPSVDRLVETYGELKIWIDREDRHSLPRLEHSIEEQYALALSLDNPKNQLFGFIPKFTFHGFQNQYHQWLKCMVVLDFGLSLVDARSATQKIFYALGWTLFYVLIAYLFSLLIAIPVGLYNAWKHGKTIEKLISSLSFIFYAFPLFWIATLAAVFLTNGLYASWLHIFPGIGVGNIYSSMSFLERISTSMPYLILPALILALHSAASGIRIVRNSAFAELKSDYYLTAKAKGLNSLQLLWRHILPNAMLPIITLLVSSFPAALTGSVVLEVIFNIPGMGRLLYDSILFMDWNVVFGILILMGLVTFVFYLIGDLLYAYLNPKIKYGVK